MEIGGAYDLEDLDSLQRSITLNGGEMTIVDQIAFNGDGQVVEEAFVTWREPVVDGNTAIISGNCHDVRMVIEEPDTEWQVASFEEESAANHKVGVLKRLSFSVPAGESIEARVSITILLSQSN